MAKLQFVRGRAYDDIDKFLADNIVENSDAEKVFYLVPEHMKFESEMTMLKHFHVNEKNVDNEFMGMLDVQVFSFNRLAWYLMQNSSLFNHTKLTQTGLAMLVQSVLLDVEEDLTIYKGLVNQTGFIRKLADLFKELRGADIAPDEFDDFIDNLDMSKSNNQNRALKFQDIQLIYNRYLEALQGKYIESEDILEALITFVEAGHLKNTDIYINHFYEFNQLEMRLLGAFMQHTNKVTIGLLLDDAKYAVELPHKAHVFNQTATSYHSIYQMARELNIPVMNDIYVTSQFLTQNPELHAIENYWYLSNQGHIVSDIDKMTQDFSESNNLLIYEAENKQAEVKHVANEIRSLVKREGYRFNEIAVLARNIGEYNQIIKPVFERNDIPVYTSTSQSMASHPLVEFILSLLNIKKNNWRYQDVMTLLKTDLIQPISKKELPKNSVEKRHYFNRLMSEFRPKVDTTENIVLAYGLQGSDWTKTDDWDVLPRQLSSMTYSNREKETVKTINEVKHFLRKELVPFFKKLDKAENNRQAATILYDFTEYLYIPDMLLSWRDDAIDNGELEKSQEHEQVWQAFVNLLDEFVDILGDKPFVLDDMIRILEIGFENAEYNNIPATLDQVVLTDLNRLSTTKDKVVFILGLTDQNLPSYTENTSLLTDQERAFINQTNDKGVTLLQDSYQKVGNEPFVAYQAFTQASEKLYMSYPKLDGDNKTSKISPYVDRLKGYFNIKSQLILNHPNLEDDVSEQLHFVGSKMETFAQAIEIISEGKTENIAPNGFWLALYEFILQNNKDNYLLRLINNSLWYRNTTKKLTKETAEQLYGKDLYLSVSEIESYYKDPFSHFLTYGLRLQERETVDIDSRKAGNFYHDAMDQLVDFIIDRDEDITDYDTEEKLQQLANQVLTQIFEQPSYFYLERNNRNKMVKSLFSETLYAMAWALREQAKLTLAKPLRTELVFGPYKGENTIEGLVYPLTNAGKLQVRGKIDRIDQIKRTEGDAYVGVVDYKSSDNKLSYERIYNGLQLQLLTYLLVAKNYQEDTLPGYALYQRIQRPIVEVKSAKKAETDSIREELLKTFKHSGLIIDDGELLDSLTMRLDKPQVSPVYQLRLKKGESTSISGGVHFTSKEMEEVFTFVEKLIINAGNKILEGDTRLMPFENEMTDSTKPIYRPISQFDVLLQENSYRQLESMDEDSFMNSIHREEEGEDE